MIDLGITNSCIKFIMELSTFIWLTSDFLFSILIRAFALELKLLFQSNSQKRFGYILASATLVSYN